MGSHSGQRGRGHNGIKSIDRFAVNPYADSMSQNLNKQRGLGAALLASAGIGAFMASQLKAPSVDIRPGAINRAEPEKKRVFKSRKERIDFARRYAARIMNIRGKLRNALARRDRWYGKNAQHQQALDVQRERLRIIDSMTNWQNHQWRKAGSPMATERLQHFAALPHWKKRTA